MSLKNITSTIITKSRVQLNLVLGYPLTHTQSPLLHNTLYQLLDCNAVMRAQVTQDLLAVLHKAKVSNTGLMAITMPFKTAVLPLLDYLSPEVESLKAANTIICREGQFYGYNTDVAGIAYALRAFDLTNKTVLIIGAGGAARAAAYYLKQQQAKLYWLNRTKAHAHELIEKFGGNWVDQHALIHLAIDVIINATPLGLYPDTKASPLPHYNFHPTQIIFDMVYNPVNTALLTTAKAHGANCISGLDMFIGQGIKQVELWLGRSIDSGKLAVLLKQTLQSTQINSADLL